MIENEKKFESIEKQVLDIRVTVDRAFPDMLSLEMIDQTTGAKNVRGMSADEGVQTLHRVADHLREVTVNHSVKAKRSMMSRFKQIFALPSANAV